MSGVISNLKLFRLRELKGACFSEKLSKLKFSLMSYNSLFSGTKFNRLF